jgi:ABC-type transport system involved in multi-copper enzyme maturation permease subunit
MDSNDSISTFGTRIIPFLAIARYDVRTLLGSWMVRLWLAGSVLLTLMLVLPNWGQLRSAPFVAVLLFPYLVFPWFLVVMVLGVDPVSGTRIESLRDGILSRPVNRHEYLLASWFARVIVVLLAYLIVIVPAVALVTLANRPVAEDSVTIYGTLAALSVVGLVLTFQVSLGFLLGTLLRRPLLAIVLLLFIWYPVNGLLSTFSLEEFSPISLSQSLPTLLRQPWSKTDGPTRANPDLDLEAISRQTSEFLSVFGGPSATPPQHKPGFFERNNYDDFSLLRVILGYGIPTAASVALATICFCLRDL